MPTHIVGHIRAQVAAHQDGRAYTYVREQGGELLEEVVGHARLDRHARGVAAWLTANVDRARPVLLLYRDAIDFLPAFLGCLYAGVVAVPAPFPHDVRSLRRVAGIFGDADVSLVLTTDECRDELTVAGWELPCVATDGPPADPDSWSEPDLDRDTTAFLQYTSGSTSAHKGVVVTHGNLLHNGDVIAEAIGAGDGTTIVGWLPHFHDMGLVGQLLQPLHSGADAVLMSPVTFLKRPHRWVELIDRHRASVTAAPNFGYELLARRITDDQLAGLDLSCLRVALNGAEPIRARTLDLVADRLAPAGFDPTAFTPCYGLAEATLCVTASPVGTPVVHLDVDSTALERNEVRPGPGGTRLISSGRPIDVDLRIVDPDTGRQLPQDQVGEIWLRGGSVTAGYWNRPADTAFRALTADGAGPFLRTGDLGFLHDGELFVTGRSKDVVIINGRNLHPQDIEEAVREVHPALTGCAGAAFGVDTGREHLAVVHGVQTSLLAGTTLPALAARIRTAVARDFDVPAPSVVLVRRTGVHLTTSGKVRRQSMRSAFLGDRIDGSIHEEIAAPVRHLRETCEGAR